MAEYVRIRKPPADGNWRRQPHHSYSETSGSQTLLSFLIAVAAFGFIAALSVYQVTEQRRATALISDMVASVTDADRLVLNQMPVLRQQAEQDEPVEVPAYPIPVLLDPAEIRDRSPEQIRDTLVARSTAAVYSDGLKIFDASEDGGQSISMFSMEGAMRFLLNRLDSSTHDRARIAMIICFIGLLVAAVLRAAGDEGFRGFRSVGAPIAFAGLVGFVFAFIGDLLADRVGGDDSFANSVRNAATSMTSLAQRNFLVVGAAGVVVVLLEPALRLAGRRFIHDEPEFLPEHHIEEDDLGDDVVIDVEESVIH